MLTIARRHLRAVQFEPLRVLPKAAGLEVVGDDRAHAGLLAEADHGLRGLPQQPRAFLPRAEDVVADEAGLRALARRRVAQSGMCAKHYDRLERFEAEMKERFA
jgi:hypothetical protein